MTGGRRKHFVHGKFSVVALATVAALLVAAPAALAHIERASYWPNPGVDTADGVPTGGKIPDAKPLFTALDPKPVGDTRVVCQGKVPKAPKKGASRDAKRRYTKRISKNASIKRLDKRIKKAVFNKNKKKRGYILRPSEGRVKVGKKAAKKLRRFNVRLLKRCRYDSIQAAVSDSGNNDRVVVMPGIYTEPESRAQPTNDPKCDEFEETNDRGNTGALSYKYQAICPNDQSLIAVIGRDVSSTPPPQPPLDDRHNLPDEGSCIRCNLQLEGSGLSPDDVIIDAGRVESGNGAPADPAKDVVIRVDRGDGFVGRNFNLRHAAEHGIYLIETDGYRVEQFKAYYNEEYGLLTFTADHALIQNCDGAGSGDSALYPGAAPDTGEQRRNDINPEHRYNTEIRFCDMHHNTAGYSGTDANAVWMHHNDLYDNANGFTTDVFTAAGHPGFPQDSDLIEKNEFYSNNFNPYLPGSDVIPITTMPVGTGMWIAGGNANIVRNNHFWDNWRRGTMLFSVPDAFACDDPEDQVPNCNPGDVSTSFRNQFYGNVMGRTPAGKQDPNGVDFWWDQQGIYPHPDSQNCWFGNSGRDGTAGSVTSLPDKSLSPPNNLPSDCGNAPAPGAQHGQAGELLGCINSPSGCAWFKTPAEPQ